MTLVLTDTYINDIVLKLFIHSLNESGADKIRKYRADYNNNPPTTVSIMPAVANTSGRLRSEFVRLLFLQSLATSGVHLAPWSVPLPSRVFLFTGQKQG